MFRIVLFLPANGVDNETFWLETGCNIIQTNGGTREGWHDQRQVCVSEWESGWEVGTLPLLAMQ